MTYRYHPELQELVDDPAGFPPAEKFVGTLEEMRAFADPSTPRCRTCRWRRGRGA